MPFHRFFRSFILPSALLLALAAYGEGLLSVNNPALNGRERQFYADAQAFEGNDALVMGQYLGSWQGPYTPRGGENIGLVSARVETGMQWSGFRLGALYRGEALVRTNRDSTDLIHQYLTNGTYDYGRSYQIDYQLRGFEAAGLRLSKSFLQPLEAGWHLSWGAGAAILQGMRLKMVDASGQAMTLSAQDVNVQATLDTRDSRMDTSGRGDFNPPYGAHPALSSQGLAFDVGAVLQRDDGLRLEAAVNDLYGYMNWQNLPQISAGYNTASKYYDAQGYVHFNPLGSSLSSYRDVTQALDPKLWLAASYPVGALELQIASSYVSGIWLPEIGASYRPVADWLLKTSYDTRFETIGVMMSRRSFYLGLRTQNVNLEAAKAYGLSMGVQFQL